MYRYRTGNILIGFLFLAVFLSGCGGPQKKISRSLEKAEEARQEGNLAQSIQILANLDERFPGNADVLESLGFAYEAEPDPFNAAIALQQAVEADPERTYLLESVAENYAAVGDYPSARTAYERYLEDFPSDGEATMALADLYREANQIESAVDAYLRGYNLLERPLRGEEAVVLGDLFFQLGNYPRAENFYQVALEGGDLSELPALFGMLKINIANTNWAVAERVVQRLDEEYPGALDASELYTVREDIADWKEARRRFEEEQQAQELASRENLENRLNQDLAAPPEQSPTRPPQDSESSDPPQDTEAETATTPNQSDDPNEEPPTDPTADRETTEENPRGGKLVVVDPEEDDDANVLEFFPQDDTPVPPPPTGLAGDIAQARQLRQDGVFSESVRLLWKVLGRDPSRPDAWFELSKTYLANNEAAAAETASLEAMRLDPANTAYVLHHFDVIRESRGRAVVIRELRLAQERFPDNPEILFELARGYDEIASDPRNAAFLYNRFLDDYPNHPLAPEVRTKLARLGY